MKNKQQRTIAAGMAVFTILCSTVKFPMPVQTIYAQDTQIPTETNTSFAKARQIESGVSAAGSMPDGGGKNYFKFSLEQAGKMDLTVDKSEHWGNIGIKIYDASQTEIYYVREGDDSFSINDIYLTGGDYYLSVEFPMATTFTFVANIDSMGESFTETQGSNNDMSSDASEISVKEKYKGVLALNDDIDYYKFQLPAAGSITLNLTNSTSNTVKYTVYDQSMNPAYTNTVKGGAKASQPVSVKSGSYYLAIAKEDVNKGIGSYTFFIDYTKKNTAAPKIKSVKNSSSGTMTVTWSSVAGADGYELWYSTNSKFKGNVVKKELDSYTTSENYYGLTYKKKYYVRLRAYSVLNGQREYGKWSAKKSVTIKK